MKDGRIHMGDTAVITKQTLNSLHDVIEDYCTDADLMTVDQKISQLIKMFRNTKKTSDDYRNEVMEIGERRGQW